jgi:hypothetical protein
MIEFENKKMLIRSDQTESARGKNIVIDDSAPPRIIRPKNAEVGLQKVDERKRKSDPRPKPTVKLLDKYTSHKANNVFSRLGGTKLSRSPSRPGGMSAGKETHMISSFIFQWSQHVGAVHHLFIHSFPCGILSIGRHTVQDQEVIFIQNILRRGLCSEEICMKRELGSARMLDQMRLL